MNIKFSIIITTFNRIDALKISLIHLQAVLERDDTEIILCDDGSNDGTYEFVERFYPNIKLIKNKKRLGLIFSRNRLMGVANGEIAISLDDDLNFLSDQPLEIIMSFFESHSDCAVQSFRIYWGLEQPANYITNQLPQVVNSFAGGAHAFRMSVWRAIPDYPSWFKFYGEENYISYYLFKNNWHIYYQPYVLTHHRVSLKNRKYDKDFITRQKRSLRSGWFLYFLFFPTGSIVRYLAYSFFTFMKKSVISLDIKSMIALFLASFDLMLYMPKLLVNRDALTRDEFNRYRALNSVPLYWHYRNMQ